MAGMLTLKELQQAVSARSTRLRSMLWPHLVSLMCLALSSIPRTCRPSKDRNLLLPKDELPSQIVLISSPPVRLRSQIP
jgi:hypothetical protein